MEFDEDCQTMTWLEYETDTEAGMKVVTNLNCQLCSKCRDRIVGRKNFSNKWITLHINFDGKQNKDAPIRVQRSSTILVAPAD